jgi:hypothetical protein
MDDHAVKHRTMQISGHTNVASINNYSTLSEERHKKISNILSNTETNRNDWYCVHSFPHISGCCCQYTMLCPPPPFNVVMFLYPSKKNGVKKPNGM